MKETERQNEDGRFVPDKLTGERKREKTQLMFYLKKFIKMFGKQKCMPSNHNFSGEKGRKEKDVEVKLLKTQI